MKRSLKGLYVLNLSVGDKPPAEFRVFGPGVNSTRKGPVVFDDQAARSVMGAYNTHGIDLMLDLEHLSLDDGARNYDPDARGWCKLEVRTTDKGPELWATNVRWTPDGEARLTEKRQRYISPAMRVDTKTRRVLELVNVAICAMPATDKLTPLVAARVATKGSSMFNPKLLAALGLAEDASDDDVAKAMADVMKDPAKFAAMISAAFDADDQEDAAGKAPAGDDEETDEEDKLAAPKLAAPGKAAPAAGPAGAPIKKVTTEYHKDSALAAEVLALRAEINTSKVRETILANRTKFTPALEKWALGAFASDPDGLTGWLKAQPVLSTNSATEKQRKGASSASEAITLSQTDLDVCKLTGTDPKAKLAHKRAQAAAGNPEAMTALIDEEN